MQLFCTEYQRQGDTIIIHDTEILHQMRKVLRLAKGDHIAVQSLHNPQTRLTIQITDRDHQTVSGVVQTEQDMQGLSRMLSLIVAMPNKRDKAELIVQKVTEIGVQHIIFRPSERSVIRQSNDKKIQRLHKIAKEAVEQSRGFTLPQITFTTDISPFTQDKQVIVFDTHPDSVITPIPQTSELIALVGPEGGLTQQDYQQLDNYIVSSLGKTIYRTETAAIIAARYLLNQ